MNILEERQFPADEVIALASRRSVGVEVSYGEKTLKCQDLETYDFTGIDLVLMSAGGGGIEGMVAEDRQAGRRRHRQFLGVAAWTRACR